jgi:hypothetical protein
MSTVADKVVKTPSTVQRRADQPSFFRKEGDPGFFGSGKQDSFFSSHPVQAKLSVSSPDDPQEKEADAMADQVMRMSEPAAPVEKEEEKPQRKQEEIEVQTKPEMSLSNKISRKEKKEDELQAKTYGSIQRSEDGSYDDASFDTEPASAAGEVVQRKNNSIYRSDIIQRSGRGPPAGSIPFEQSLSSSKGSGMAMPGETRQFMESRFQADFSGVRIHTGSHAESMSREIHAQAFTHGNDIYFNSGKYSPGSESGSTLLAHELTHTIQQGASKPVTPSTSNGSTGTSVSAKSLSVSRKKIIHRSTAGTPPQMTNAVAKAKSMEGKINAKMPGPDGYRTGWQHLLDIFKTTFGEDKIISGAGGTNTPGTVAEMDIKKYRVASDMQLYDTTGQNRKIMGDRDAMPSWCGIFVFWALNKSGIPLPKWELGRSFIKPEAITPAAGYTPRPGDIAWKKAFSHFAIVESVSGDSVRCVNGNTAGADNMGGQVQSREHKLTEWDAYMNPVTMATGPLTSGEAPAEKPKTFDELRKELFKLNRKEGNEPEIEETNKEEENKIQEKPELSDWQVDKGGKLQTGQPDSVNIQANNNKVQAKEEEKKEEDDKQGMAVQPMLQKKPAFDIHTKCAECEQEETQGEHEHDVQRQTEVSDSSLNTLTNAETDEQGAEMDRGPPLQAKQFTGNGIIQRSVIDDALEYAGSVTDCISTD